VHIVGHSHVSHTTHECYSQKCNTSNQTQETALQIELLQNMSLSRAGDEVLKAEDRTAVRDIQKQNSYQFISIHV